MLFILCQVLSSVKGFFVYALFNLIPTVPVAVDELRLANLDLDFEIGISDRYSS